jgi:type 1 fimbria pilin
MRKRLAVLLMAVLLLVAAVAVPALGTQHESDDTLTVSLKTGRARCAVTLSGSNLQSRTVYGVRLGDDAELTFQTGKTGSGQVKAVRTDLENWVGMTQANWKQDFLKTIYFPNGDSAPWEIPEANVTIRGSCTSP